MHRFRSNSPTCSLMCSLVGDIQFELNNTFNDDKSALIYKKLCVTSRPQRCFPVRVSARPPDVMAKTSIVGSGLWNVWQEACFSIHQFKVVVCWDEWTLEKMDFRGALAVKNNIDLGFDFKKEQTEILRKLNKERTRVRTTADRLWRLERLLRHPRPRSWQSSRGDMNRDLKLNIWNKILKGKWQTRACFFCLAIMSLSNKFLE